MTSRSHIGLAAAILVGCAAPRSSMLPNRPSSIAITGVTLLDGTGGDARLNATVTISDGVILEVSDGRNARVAPGTRIIDGRGKYLIPGLCDAHAHIRHGDRSLELFVAHGITCIRQMFDDMAQIRAQVRAIQGGDRLGPRLLAVAGFWPDSVRPGRAGAIADSLRAEGATFFKTGTNITADAFEAARREGGRLSFFVLGHLPVKLSSADVVASGMRSLEHLGGLELAASPREEQLRARSMAATAARDPSAARHVLSDALDTTLPERLDSLLRAMAVRRMYVTPTLISHQRAAHAGDSAFTADPRLRDIPATTQAAWQNSRYAQPRSADQRLIAHRLFMFQQRLVRRMFELGVPLLAGSDAGDVYTYDGSSLHDELRALATAGVPPRVLLDAVTRAPVAAAGAEDSLGTVEKGKLADLVLLDADPRVDVGNLTRIAAVILRGRVLDRAALRGLIEKGR